MGDWHELAARYRRFDLEYAANSYRVPASVANTSRYMNVELDAAIDSYFTTLPVPEDMRNLRSSKSSDS